MAKGHFAITLSSDIKPFTAHKIRLSVIQVSGMDEETLQLLRQTETYRVDHLPVISAYCQRLGLTGTVDALVPAETDVSPGTVIQALVMDTLSGRSPLYRLEDFFEKQDTELLFEQKVEPASLNDSSVGRTIDRIYEAGTQSIFSEIAWKACQLSECDLKHLHFDTTSVNVYGDYLPDEKTGEGLNITHGYSKDHRPDLKQFLLQTLCVEKNIPLLGGCEDGNASDKTINNQVLTRLTHIMSRYGLEPGAFIYTADSAMVTEDNLEVMGDNLFITRLPASYGECGRTIQEVVAKDEWQEIGILAETRPTKNRPAASYRAAETQVTLYSKTYRAVVVHSSAHDKRRQKKLEKTLTSEKERLMSLIRKEQKTWYACQKDAQTACQRIEEIRSPYFSLKAQVFEKVIYQRGRPSPDKPRKVNRREYHIEVEIEKKQEAIECKEKESGCFVLLTNVPEKVAEESEQGSSAEDILRCYKDQHGVERNFSFLKDPLIVNSLFLKNPERIEVLGMVLLIALLIWSLMERNMRKHLQETGGTLQGLDNRKTNRPTSFMMTLKFFGVMIMVLNGVRVLAKPLTPVQLAYLKALGLSEGIFTTAACGIFRTAAPP